MSDTPAPPDTDWSSASRSDGGRNGAARNGGGRGDSGQRGYAADDGWSPATNVRGGAAYSPVHAPRPPRPTGAERRPSPYREEPYRDEPYREEPYRGEPYRGEQSRREAPTRDEPYPPEWAPAGPLSSSEQRATRRAERQAVAAGARLNADPAQRVAAARAPERGLPWWAALLILIAISAVGGVIDTIGSPNLKGGFNIGIVVASVVAILVVKRSHMFPVVIAPPIVYSAAALFQLYIRSSGLHDKKVVFDAAANYLVYGFPAIAAATAAVLIIAGIRLIIRK